jgi:hypothetical protein
MILMRVNELKFLVKRSLLSLLMRQGVIFENHKRTFSFKYRYAIQQWNKSRGVDCAQIFVGRATVGGLGGWLLKRWR